jgi:hypothetical protein
MRNEGCSLVARARGSVIKEYELPIRDWYTKTPGLLRVI